MTASDQELPSEDRPCERTSTVIHLSTLPHLDDSAFIFVAQLTSQDTTELIYDERKTDDGQIRNTITEPPNLYSKSCVGLAVSAAVVGFCGALVATVFKPLFISGYLANNHANLVSSTSTVLQWPPVFAVAIGALSDGLIPSGFKRKMSLVVGWLLVFVALGAATVVGYTADLASSDVAVVLIALSVLATIGFQVVSVVSLAITVDHAQRETTDKRGHFQGSYFLVFYSAAALTQLFVSRSLVKTSQAGTITSLISLQETLAILAGCAVVPIPFILGFLDERGSSRMSCRTSAKSTISPSTSSLWAYIQQKPVYRIYLFLFGVVFLVNAKSSDANRALLTWSGVSPDKTSNIVIAQAMPKVVAVALWKYFMINLNWRVLGVCGLALYSLCFLVLTLACGLGAWRDEWTYYAWTAVASIPLGWFEVFLVILPTEVAGVGHEGLSMGLVSTFIGLITITSSTLWDSINDAVGFSISSSDILADDSTTRHEVVVIGVVYALINLSSVALAPLLPLQKREAQEWRMFGDSSRPAAHLLGCVFALLLTYNLLANWLIAKL